MSSTETELDDPILIHLITQTNKVLGDRRRVGRRDYHAGYADQMFRNDPELNRLIIQARLIKKSMTRLSIMLNQSSTLEDKERISDMIEHKKELLRLARIQVKRRKIVLDQLLAIYQRIGVPDWNGRHPGMNLTTQLRNVVDLGSYLIKQSRDRAAKDVTGQSLADLNRHIVELDRQINVLGPSATDNVQRKYLNQQKYGLITKRDGLTDQTPITFSRDLLDQIQKIRLLNGQTYLPQQWGATYPPAGLVPLQRAFTITERQPYEDFLPTTLHELFRTGSISDDARANWAIGIISSL